MLHFLLIIVLAAGFNSGASFAEIAPPGKTIYATERGGSVYFEGKTIATEEINTAVRKSRPGDTVFILPGTYEKPLNISKNGEIDRPIRIVANQGLVVFRCGYASNNKSSAAVQLSISSHVTIEGLRIVDCPTLALRVADSEYVSISDMQFEDVKTAIDIEGQDANHILVSNSRLSGKKNGPPVFARLLQVGGDIHIRHNFVDEGRSMLEIADRDNQSGAAFETRNILVEGNLVSNLTDAVVNIGVRTQNLWIRSNVFSSVASLLSEKTANKVELSGNYIHCTEASIAVVSDNNLKSTCEVPKATVHEMREQLSTWLAARSFLPFKRMDTNYPSHAIVKTFIVEGERVRLDLDRWVPQISNISLTVELNSTNPGVNASTSCIAKNSAITCTFPKGSVLPKVGAAAWLEVPSSLPLSLWGSDLKELRLVKKP